MWVWVFRNGHVLHESVPLAVVADLQDRSIDRLWLGVDRGAAVGREETSILDVVTGPRARQRWIVEVIPGERSHLKALLFWRMGFEQMAALVETSASFRMYVFEVKMSRCRLEVHHSRRQCVSIIRSVTKRRQIEDE